MSNPRANEESFKAVAVKASEQKDPIHNEAKQEAVKPKNPFSKAALAKLVLIRNLSATYTDPVTHKPTQEDPRCFNGEERIARENAVLSQLAHTGYAFFIAQRRAKQLEPVTKKTRLAAVSSKEEVAVLTLGKT